MEISRPNQAELTAEEQQELEKLRAIIEQASVDGYRTGRPLKLRTLADPELCNIYAWCF